MKDLMEMRALLNPDATPSAGDQLKPDAVVRLDSDLLMSVGRFNFLFFKTRFAVYIRCRGAEDPLDFTYEMLDSYDKWDRK